jgi:hypothetical protein
MSQKILVAVVTPEQLQAILFGGSTKGLPVEKPSRVGALVEDPEQYVREPGTPTGVQGRPYKLNEAGLKKIWDLYKAGNSVPAIARAFRGVIGVEAVRRLVRKIEAK